MAPGTPFRRIRMDDDMWKAFAEAVAKADPELDRSKVMRQLVRWYIGETDHLPRRPAGKSTSADDRIAAMQALKDPEPGQRD